nr:unnamed protein product [Callosobruchus analis]
MMHLSEVMLFADDTKIYKTFDPEDCEAAIDELNRDLAAIVAYSKRSSLTLNPSKSEAILFAPKTKILKSLQTEVKELKSLIDKRASTSESFHFEEVVQEVFHRNQRKNNLIIYGVQENQSLQTSADKNQNFDKNQAKQVLEALSYVGDTGVLKPVRLGRYDPTKSSSRPLKIRLEDEVGVSSYLMLNLKLKCDRGHSRNYTHYFYTNREEKES